MITTLGKMPSKMPKGFFKAVEFPVLAMLDKQTGDHRMLLGSGAGSRNLPLSIKYASKTSAMGGHDGAEVSGALFEVTIDPDNGKMSGRGFLLNDEHGRRHARLIATQAMSGNSVDLAEVKARFVEDFETGEWWIEFTDFKLAATTGVATPAFAEAHAVVEDLTDDELVASVLVAPMEPLVAQEPDEVFIVVLGEPEDTELTAALGHVVPFDAFYVPEASVPTKVVVDADGNVYGHLALWDSCHDGYADRCMRVPRPTDGYASFNQSGPLTERGHVQTGPIFALGGHRSAKSAPTIDQAYGGIENCWADVRVIEGKLGPWISGRVRPGVDDDLIYAVRASRISGHWVNGKLKAIVSVNAAGFEVPGLPESAVDFSSPFSFAMNDDGVAELVASYCGAPAPTDQMSLTFNVTGINDANAAAAVLYETLSSTLNGQAMTITTSSGTTWAPSGPVTPLAVEHSDDEDFEEVVIDREWADEQLAALLEDDRDEDDLS